MKQIHLRITDLINEWLEKKAETYHVSRHGTITRAGTRQDVINQLIYAQYYKEKEGRERDSRN